MKRNIRDFFFGLLLSVLLVGCESFQGGHSESTDAKEEIVVSNIQFEPGYKSFTIDIKLDNGIPLFLENNPQIKVKATEIINNRVSEAIQPELVSVKNIKAEELERLNLHVLVLVDLTLPSYKIDFQKELVKSLRIVFSADNLYVSFIRDNAVSESMLATDYVLDNYFKPDNSTKYLYRSILSKLEEITASKPVYFPGAKQNEVWGSFPAGKKGVVVLSDGKVYNDNNEPIDREHYDLQQTLSQLGFYFPFTPVFYVNIHTDGEEGEGGENEQSIFKLLCGSSGGKYFDSLGNSVFSSEDFKELGIESADYQLAFVNPDRKVYQGNLRRLQIDCYDGERRLMTGHINYSLGSIYNPVIVNGISVLELVLWGCLLGAIIILLIYLAFQFVVPWIRYQIFKRKYVVRYTKKNMTHNGVLVEQSCYFCKAPFEEGDEIVAKCAHVVHKGCWDENEYKCPEYGQKCKDGSHYYNRKNLWDKRNASFYLSWVIAGILAGLIAWACFMSYTDLSDDEGDMWVSIMLDSYNVASGSEAAGKILNNYAPHFFYLPFYGLNMSLFLTFFLTWLAGHGRWRWKRLGILFSKSVLAGLCGYLSFLVGGIISVVIDITGNSFIVDWIPWILTGFVIAFIVSFGTDIRREKAMIGALISIVFGLGSMYIWNFSLDSLVDMRDYHLLSYMIYSVGFAVSIAANSPKSERYFLRVEGPIKGMDIAIYKWIKAPDHGKRMTIGKSVNCDLQMTWDLNGCIMPEVAELRMRKNGYIYLCALDEGLVVGNKPQKPNAKMRLYHGSKFMIGQTSFTYLERDI